MRTYTQTIIIASIILLLAAPTLAQGGAVPGSGFNGPVNNFQAYTPTFDRLYSGQASTYWPILNQLGSEQCQANSDFVIAIPPGGCTPSVVRSDLLAEQNVPVFCQLYSVQTNPLIEVSSIRSIAFKGNYPDSVAAVSFHPARAAARSYRTLTGDPLINNIGYVVIILKRNPNIEQSIEEWVAGNLTATIRYDAQDAFGVGQSEYYLPIQNEEQWDNEYQRSSFWRGRGYLRATDVDGDKASIQVLANKNQVVNTATLQVGQTSDVLYLPGYYCNAGLQVTLKDVVALEDSALLNVNEQELWVRQGSKILNGQCTVTNLNLKQDGTGDVNLGCAGSGRVTLQLRTNNNQTIQDANVTPLQEQYFKESQEALQELLTQYSQLQKDGNIGTYGEEALLNQIELTKRLGKEKTRITLLEQYLRLYPEAPSANWVRTELANSGTYNYAAAYKNVYVGDKFHTIGISALKPLQTGQKSVDLRIGTTQITQAKEGDNATINDGIIRINRILPAAVELSFTPNKAGVAASTKRIDEGSFGNLGSIDVYVQNVEAEEAAYVSLQPRVQSTTTNADFTFRIGIEKRAIELSPERSKKMLENVENSIEKWEDINEKLGSVVEGMKGACFATSAFLMAKNVLTGFDGTALSRQKVMNQYKIICDTEHPDKTRTECFNDLSADIDRDVEAMRQGLTETNEQMDNVIQNHEVSGGFLSDGTVIDQKSYVDELRNELPSGWETEVNGVEINRGDLETSTQIRAALLAEKLQGQGVSGKAANIELEQALKSVAARKQSNQAITNAQAKLAGLFEQGANPSVISHQPEGTTTLPWGGQTVETLAPKGISEPEDAKVQLITSQGTEYLLILRDSVGNVAGVTNVYEAQANTWQQSNKQFNIVFDTRQGDGVCDYPWPTGTARVRYYETGASKGNPAVVPFDLEKGLYAMISDSNGNAFDSDPQGYTQAGVAKYFKICSIGPNKIMEHGSYDDTCQSFSDNTANQVNKLAFCPSKTPAEVQQIYQNAVQAIRQASAQYGQGQDISILDQIMQVGSPLAQAAGLECQDFMSPDECLLMFNICDPVICPPSRCDMGGKNPVADVIQTGVVGSIAQCLPNAKEGIIAPVCLSGVHAGLDAYVSILESERACLNQSIETGQLVGICDEITAVYKCEFFWRQASPIMNLLVPKLVTSITGSSERTRGGGEYLLAQTAWDNLDNSVDYFTNNYAQNAFKAFQLRNVEEAGSAFCRNFLGTSLPTSADAIDQLLEPESPFQFYARFSEIPFSEATIPATSQYKVYYHIYAGNDQGAQYRIYLKNPPASGYYATNPTVQVKTGFIAKGTSADEAIDFTAPEGYKELCIDINGRQECGFKQVTSDFGLDYLADKFTEEQATQTGITTEQECIQGSPSIYQTLQPNIQSGIEESTNPDISLRGIVRICANENPNAGFNSSRWKEVGYCGEQNFKCWLDLNSVKNDLERVANIEGKQIPLQELERNTNNILTQTQNSHQNATDLLVQARQTMKNFELTKLPTILNLLTQITGNTTTLPKGTNKDRAEALSLQNNLYNTAIQTILQRSTTQTKTARETTIDETFQESYNTVEFQKQGDKHYLTTDTIPTQYYLETPREPILIFTLYDPSGEEAGTFSGGLWESNRKELTFLNEYLLEYDWDNESFKLLGGNNNRGNTNTETFLDQIKEGNILKKKDGSFQGTVREVTENNDRILIKFEGSTEQIIGVKEDNLEGLGWEFVAER